MKKTNLVVILVLLTFFLPGCDWVRTQLGMPTSADMDAVNQQNMLAISKQTPADSILKSKVDSIARMAIEPAGRYFIVMGSFKDPANAKKMSDRLTKNGYTPTAFQMKNGFTMVAAASFNSRSEANAELDKLSERGFAPNDIWLYDINQQLHIK